VLFLDGASCLGINGDPDAGHLGLVQHVEKFGHHRIPFRQIPATFLYSPVIGISSFIWMPLTPCLSRSIH
jgi:hypothetical protein